MFTFYADFCGFVNMPVIEQAKCSPFRPDEGENGGEGGGQSDGGCDAV